MTTVAPDKVDARARPSSSTPRNTAGFEIEPLTDTWPELDERTAYAIQKRLGRSAGRGRGDRASPGSSSA